MVPHARLLVLPLLLTGTIALTACGSSDEDKVQDKAEQLQKDIQSGKLSPDEIAERSKELLNDPAVKEQVEKATEQLKKASPEEIQKQLKESGVDTEELERKAKELREQLGDVTVPTTP